MKNIVIVILVVAVLLFVLVGPNKKIDFEAWVIDLSSTTVSFGNIVEELGDIWRTDYISSDNDDTILGGFLNTNFAEVLFGTFAKIGDTLKTLGTWVVSVVQFTNLFTPWENDGYIVEAEPWYSVWED